MNEFVAAESKVLSDYESHKKFVFKCYSTGVRVKTTQNEVVYSGSEVENHSALIITYLKEAEVIELRDYLLANYPI